MRNGDGVRKLGNGTSRRSSTRAGLALIAALAAPTLLAAPAAAWRSALYPETWAPGYADASGRTLQDFSYAGYHAGEDPIPESPPGDVFDATAHGADPSGAADSTAAIQAAIDAAGAAGGGVVLLPAGTYRVRPPAGRTVALRISHDGVVLRGEGTDRTFLFNDEPDMRGKRVVWLGPREEYYVWWWDGADARPLATDAPAGATTVRVGDASGYAVGELVLVGADATDAFIAEHGMTGTWTPADTPGPIFYRRVVAIEGDAVTLDAPIRYPLKVRDGARLFRPALAPVREVGVEHLSIGNRQNDTSGTDTDDYTRPGTGGYQMHDSFLVYLNHVVDGWVRDVATYRPATNSRDVHLLSNAVRVDFSRHVTLSGLDLENPQYRGAGGNGYLVTLTANDCLVIGSTAQNGRHNYSLSFMHSSGNVIHRSVARGGRLPVDFHQRLAFANLLDGLAVDDDSVEMVFRDCCTHGHSTTESVVWNLEGIRYPRDQFFDRFVVETQQYGHGYVIGTRGAATNVRARTGDGTGPADLVEGQGQGATLTPASLYLDQLERRLGRPIENAAPIVDAGADVAARVGEAVALSGRVTDDGLPAPASLSVIWSVTSGPGSSVRLDPANAAATAATFGLPGSYVLELRASDGALEARDSLTVTVTEPAAVDDGGAPTDDGSNATPRDAGVPGEDPEPPPSTGCTTARTPAPGGTPLLAWSLGLFASMRLGRRRRRSD